MGASYHQFCPVAKAMELLDERWTMLVLRELISGSQRFNDLRRGVPRMSPTLLSKRLNQLVAAGVIERAAAGQEVQYTLTPAGKELAPIIEAVGAWGVRWIGELGDADLDPKLLLWDMRRNVNHMVLPPGRSVVRFTFPEVPAAMRDWWLVLTRDEADVCDDDPGHPVSIAVTSSLRLMTSVWRGDTSWAAALRYDHMRLDGPVQLRRSMPGWFRLSMFAAVPRPTTRTG
jgi:DNA-binding HxlR family transcriptional regulator